MYKISVILPVYNNEATLRRAIESILNQSVLDFELILIDDGSTDSSAQICMVYAKREPLIIRLIHQERLGFAQARNRGLNLAKGSYIYFADPQNVFAHRMLETNLKLAEEKKAELVVFGFFEADEAIEQIPKLPYLLSKERFRNHYRNFHYFFPYELCNKLYQVQYLRERNIKFRNVPLKETAFFNLDVYEDLNKVVFNRQVFCQKEEEKSGEIQGDRKNHWEINLHLIEYLQGIFSDWELIEEYEDVIISECYQVLTDEVLNLSSSNLIGTTEELESEIEQLLKKKRIRAILDKEQGLPTKSFYEKVLWNHYRNRNTRAIINLIQRKKQRNRLSRKLKNQFNKWFTN